MEFAILIALNTALVEALKQAFKADSRFMPLISIMIGIAIAYFAGLSGDVSEMVIQGLIMGLSASGLYDFTRKTLLDK